MGSGHIGSPGNQSLEVTACHGGLDVHVHCRKSVYAAGHADLGCQTVGCELAAGCGYGEAGELCELPAYGDGTSGLGETESGLFCQDKLADNQVNGVLGESLERYVGGETADSYVVGVEQTVGLGGAPQVISE